MVEVGRRNRENFGECMMSSGESKQENPVLKVMMTFHESQESSMGRMEVYMKVSVLHIESYKPHYSF